MATVVVTLRIMPDSPETNLDSVASAVKMIISDFGGNVGRADKEPVAFGLNALVVMFAMPEEKGSTEVLENQIAEIEGVNSVQVTDVRRAVG